MPGIVSGLQAEPDRRPVADQLADPGGDVGLTGFFSSRIS
jgi:hypothetical protein